MLTINHNMVMMVLLDTYSEIEARWNSTETSSQINPQVLGPNFKDKKVVYTGKAQKHGSRVTKRDPVEDRRHCKKNYTFI